MPVVSCFFFYPHEYYREKRLTIQRIFPISNPAICPTNPNVKPVICANLAIVHGGAHLGFFLHVRVPEGEIYWVDVKGI